MNEMKGECKKNRCNPSGTLFFIIGLIFIDLFGFNPERMENSQVTKNLVLPYISLNITSTMFVLSIAASAICFIGSKSKWKVPSNVLTLVARIALYFFPLLYMQGDFKIGVAYAMIQCAFSYYIGANNTSEYKTVLNLLVALMVGLSIEVFAVLYLNKLSLFSPDIKWYMVIPIGKSNYITCVILPIYVATVEYYGHKFKPIITIAFSGFIFSALLATGSKFALVLFVGYWFVKFLQGAISNKKIEKRKFARNVLLACVLISGIVYIFIAHSVQVNIILGRFGVSTLFSNRINVYKETMELIFQHLLFGRSAYSYHVFDAVKAHNWLLESLVQTGLIGTAVYGYALYIGVRVVRRIKQKDIRVSVISFVIMYLFQGMVEPNLFGTLSDALFWLVLGVAFAIYKNEGKSYEE